MLGTVVALLGGLTLGGLLSVLWSSRGPSEPSDTAPILPADVVRSEALDALALRLDDVAARVTSRLDGYDAEIASLADTLHDQNIAIADGIAHVDRAERRVRSTVQRARERMERLGYIDDAVEAEAEGLRQIDAPNGSGEGVHPVHEPVEPPDMSAFPGQWS